MPFVRVLPAAAPPLACAAWSLPTEWVGTQGIKALNCHFSKPSKPRASSSEAGARADGSAHTCRRSERTHRWTCTHTGGSARTHRRKYTGRAQDSLDHLESLLPELC